MDGVGRTFSESGVLRNEAGDTSEEFERIFIGEGRERGICWWEERENHLAMTRLCDGGLKGRLYRHDCRFFVKYMNNKKKK